MSLYLPQMEPVMKHMRQKHMRGKNEQNYFSDIKQGGMINDTFSDILLVIMERGCLFPGSIPRI